METRRWGVTSAFSGDKGDNPALQSLHEGLSGWGRKNEIPPGINEFYPLPLTEPLIGHLFFTCPAGIAVTDKRLWVSHSPFSDPQDDEYLWISWPRFETVPPRYLLAFGKLNYKVEKLSAAMTKRTKSKSIQKHVVPDHGGIGEYTLTITPKNNLLVVEFIENGQTSGALVEVNLAI